MLAFKIKDIKLRKKFSKIENLKKINKFLFINLLSQKSKKLSDFCLHNNLLKLQINTRISRVRIKNRCVLTNRNKGVSKYYSLSRIVMRDFMQFGILPGYTKAVW
jgi:ribosomal protein S14